MVKLVFINQVLASVSSSEICPSFGIEYLEPDSQYVIEV